MSKQTDLTLQNYQIVIKASPERIWTAITTPEETLQYFHGARITTTATAHKAYGPDGDVWGDGAVMEWDPPRRLVHEWRSLYNPELASEPASRVTWEITPNADGTSTVTVTHDQLERSPGTAQGVSGAGWTGVLTGLQGWVESGQAANQPS